MRLKGLIRLLCLFFLIQMAMLPAAGAQEGHPPGEVPSGAADPYQLLDKSISESLGAEKKQLNQYLNRLSGAKEFEQLCRERLDAYRIQLSAHRNILALPTIESYDLREANNQHQVTLSRLTERAGEIEDRLAQIRAILSKTQAKLASYENQKAEIQEEQKRSELLDKIRQQIAELTEAVSAQIEILNDIESIYAGLLERTRQIRSEYQTVAEEFEKRIAKREQQRLLQRSVNPIAQLGVEQIRFEVDRIRGKLREFVSFDYWLDLRVGDKNAYTLFVLAYFFLLAAIELLLWFCRRFFTRLRDSLKEAGRFWQYLTVRLIRRSLFLLGAILFIWFFPVKPAYEFTPLFGFLRILVHLLVLLLFVRWGINFLKVLWSDAESPFLRFLCFYLRILLYGILGFGVVYYLLAAGLCMNCVLLVLIRIVFELALLVWSFFFWHRFRFYSKDSQLYEYPGFHYIKPLLPALGYLIVLVGLFFEIIGYGAMATFWYASLIKSAATLFWIGVLYMVVKEVSPGGESKAAEEDLEPGAEKPMPIRKFLIRLSKVGLFVLLILGIPMAWGARGDYLADFFYTVNYKIKLGGFQISLLDLGIALLVILLTHTVVIVAKAVLREQILAHRDLEPGLKDSITTITGYVAWVIGIMIVFRVIGISAASLAVLFGAVGIGIGFGLQNIFNNFLSGIILLFERPIQVGDVVEVNGIWGTVAKINVRATQVKTYDNADLIIPNADMISQQLTNWSFKDARVRRTITVGVAYGSDAPLVRDTLNTIALNHPRVYRRPQPEVLFSDFGENALIFKLRVWVHINYFLSVETDLRFEINKEFSDLGIHIPVPQRDIYLKSGYYTAPAPPKVAPEGSET